MSSGSKDISYTAALTPSSTSHMGDKSLIDLSEEEQLKYALKMSKQSSLIRVKHDYSQTSYMIIIKYIL